MATASAAHSQPQKGATIMKISIYGFSTTRRFAAIAILASFVFSNVFAINALRGGQMTVSSATAKYTTDLTQLGREGRLREDLSFEKETTSLIKVLAEGGVRQPVIVSEDAAVQNAVVEQVALRIANGTAPSQLAGKSILKIETSNLFSNAHTKDEAAQMIDSIVNDAIATKGQTILFVDELSNMVGASAATSTIFDSIAAGKLVIIGGSSAAGYDNRIESQPEIAAYFAGIIISEKYNSNATADFNNDSDDEFRGDNVSPDLRDMMAQDPSGTTRVDVILQAKDADNAALRSLMASGQAHITDRIGKTDTLVVNLPLSALNALSTSGLINYVSPDRQMTTTGHVEDSTGAAVVRSQPAHFQDRVAIHLLKKINECHQYHFGYFHDRDHCRYRCPYHCTICFQWI